MDDVTFVIVSFVVFFGTFAVLSALCDWVEKRLASKRRWRR